MKNIKEKKLVIAGLMIAGFVFVLLAFLTPVAEGGADNYAHFNIARWAFKYPHLFLDHWGKPVYTIVAAPFSLFGFVTVRILNSVLGLLAGWFVWKLAEKLKFENAWFAVVGAVFTPIYFALMSTGMTEIIFSLILVLSVYLFMSEKYTASATLVSFLFLARTEGLAFELLFLIALLIKKQYRAIPLLATGFLVFSFIGLVYYYHDFWWLYNKRPYATGGPTVYGRGDWYHFFVTMPNYLGYVVAFLLFIGSGLMVYDWFREKLNLSGLAFIKILLILGTFWGYFFIHSYLWWKGETSAGLQRVMAGVSPMIGLIALSVIEKVAENKIVKRIIIPVLVLFSVIMMYNAGRFYKRSIGYDLSAEILNRATNWLEQSGSLKHKLVMHNPYFSFSTEIDAWDNNVVQYGFSNNDAPEEGLPDSTIFIWDAHFSAHEGGLPLEKIMNNPNFEVVQYFDPVVPFKAFGLDYQIVIFRKIVHAGKNNILLLEDLKKNEIENGIYYVESYDFDSTVPVENVNLSYIKFANDSTRVYYDLNGVEFSPAFHIKKESIEKGIENKFRVSADFYIADSISQNRLLMVFSAEVDNKSYHYVTADIDEEIVQNNEWIKAGFIFTVPDDLKPGTIIKSYIWNMDKKAVLMDNFKLEIARQAGNKL
jgi:hypothetical protein